MFIWFLLLSVVPQSKDVIVLEVGMVDRLVPFKMLYLIGPDGLVNRGFINFQKMVWMTMVHVLQNLHTFGLQGMQNISDFPTNRILRTKTVGCPSCKGLLEIPPLWNATIY